MIAVAALDARFGVKARAVGNEVVDLPGGLAHHHLDGGAIAQPGSGGQGVLDVVLEAIFRRAHGGDAALGVVAVALLQAVLGDDEGAQLARRGQGRTHAGDADADDEQIGEQMRRLLGTEANEITLGKRHVCHS
jgi:hypothetical protein